MHSKQINILEAFVASFCLYTFFENLIEDIITGDLRLCQRISRNVLMTFPLGLKST